MLTLVIHPYLSPAVIVMAAATLVLLRRKLPCAATCHHRLALALIIIAALARITATYPIFSHTYDEPAHIAAGMELLDRGSYTFELQHPPLARLAVALGPYLAGSRLDVLPGIWWEQGYRILYDSGDYWLTLSLARAGVLPFFVLLVLATWWWAAHEFGNIVATAAALLLTTLPPVLAHAGLATTDLPEAASLTLALFALVLWMQRPSARRGLALGCAAGMAITCKLSGAIFLPVCLVALSTYRWASLRGSREWPGMTHTAACFSLLTVAAGLFVVVWAVYGFSADLLEPVGQVWSGLQEALSHNATGHWVYFVGEVRDHGWWYFYPVTLALKTPVPFLVLAVVGIWVLVRAHRGQWRSMAPAIFAAAVLLVGLISSVDLGIRYILGIYPMLAIVAGVGAVRLLAEGRRSFLRIAGGALVIWHVAASATAHPDYLGYFNPLAGRDPGRLLADSDLDWGQDVQRLSDELRQRGVRHVLVDLHGKADLEKHGFPDFAFLEPHKPAAGWIAISITSLDFGSGAPPYDGYVWLLKFQPITTVGKSIKLYHIDSPPPFSRAGEGMK